MHDINYWYFDNVLSERPARWNRVNNFDTVITIYSGNINIYIFYPMMNSKVCLESKLKLESMLKRNFNRDCSEKTLFSFSFS